MLAVGYTKAYAKSYCGKMWDNKHLIEAIARIDAKSAKKSGLTIQMVLEDLAWGIEQAREKQDLPSLARLSELRGKYLSMWSDAGNNSIEQPRELSTERIKELEQYMGYPRKAKA